MGEERGRRKTREGADRDRGKSDLLERKKPGRGKHQKAKTFADTEFQTIQNMQDQ